MHSTLPTPRDWLARFFAWYYGRHPVSATFIGVHQHDGGLPDLSESGVGDTLAEMRALLATIPAQEPGRTPERPLAQDVDALDVRLAAGFLRTASWELESGHQHLRNPSLYTGEAAFGVLSLFLTENGSLADRVDAAISRMSTIPELLGQGRDNVRRSPAGWIGRALRECDGGVALFTDGVARLAAERGIDDRRFARAAEKAARAFAVHKAHLAAELQRVDEGDPGCGEDALDLHLREAHFLWDDADEIARYAEDALAEARSTLLGSVKALGAASPEEAQARVADLHPGLDRYLLSYPETWNRMRAVAVERELVTWPDAPIRYMPRPGWTRAAAPHLYFLYYRSPAAFDRPPLHDYLVTPIEASMSGPEQERLLREHNDAAITLNHVVHHGGLGHHVQNWHAFRAASRVGRIAAVDGSSRIAMLCGGTMAEGWACYATDLMAEVGALTPTEVHAERHARVRMAARSVVDIRLHQGRFTPEQAIELYRRSAGMSMAAAAAEVVKNGMFPGAALMYLTGTDAIHRLRRRVAALRGEAFTLRGFHDQLLAHGSIPVSLIAEKMIWEAAGAGTEVGRAL